MSSQLLRAFLALYTTMIQKFSCLIFLELLKALLKARDVGDRYISKMQLFVHFTVSLVVPQDFEEQCLMTCSSFIIVVILIITVVIYSCLLSHCSHLLSLLLFFLLVLNLFLSVEMYLEFPFSP